MDGIMTSSGVPHCSPFPTESDVGRFDLTSLAVDAAGTRGQCSLYVETWWQAAYHSKHVPGGLTNKTIALH